LKFHLFICFVVDFILRSFLFTQIEIVILTTKKYFLHRASLHFLLVIKLFFAATTEPMNIIMQIVQGLLASRNVTTS